jgi:hypothetical protein
MTATLKHSRSRKEDGGAKRSALQKNSMGPPCWEFRLHFVTVIGSLSRSSVNWNLFEEDLADEDARSATINEDTNWENPEAVQVLQHEGEIQKRIRLCT